MKLCTSRLNGKRIRKTAFVGSLFVVFLFVFFLSAFSSSKVVARAASVDWNMKVAYSEQVGSSPKYYDLQQEDTYTQEDKKIFFMLSGFGTDDNAVYYYYVGTAAVGDAVLKSDSFTSWNTLIGVESTPQEYEQVSYYIVGYDIADEATDLYIYFCKKGLGSSTEYYPVSWHIIVNTLNGDDNEIVDISCVYSVNGEDKVYTGEWTSAPLTFTVKTKVMGDGEYVSGREILSYSLNFNKYYEEYIEQNGQTNDGKAEAYAAQKANWSFLGSNRVSISGISLNGSYVWFRVTDISGSFPKYRAYQDTDGNKIGIRFDPYSPTFQVTALKVDRSIYASGSWTSGTVSFVLTNTSKCPSDITFKYSNNGGISYMDIKSSVREGVLTGTLDIVSSTASLKFLAVNSAGNAYEYSQVYVINIDSVKPQAYAEGFTTDPDVSSKEKQLTASPLEITDGFKTETVSSFGYANGNVIFRVYNRDVDGKQVVNNSGNTFYYQDASSRDAYTNNWTKMQKSVVTMGGETYFEYAATLDSDISMTKYVCFKVVSGAGLESDVLEVKVVVLNSVFSIDLPENYIEATYSNGWISDQATIYVIVPTDSKSVSNEYTLPTTQYSFYYWSEELTGEGTIEQKIKRLDENSVAKGTPVSFVEEKNGVVYWKYKFSLVASANNFFNIRGMNAAGKLSVNYKTTTNPVKIDVLPPEYEVEAFIFPINNSDYLPSKADDLYKEGKIIKLNTEDYDAKNTDDAKGLSGKFYAYNYMGWVNGSISLIIKIKKGVSDVYLKDMEFAKDTNGNPLYSQSTKELIWQEQSGKHPSNMTGQVGDDEYYYYYITFNKDDAESDILTREYRFRIYTGSGIFTQIGFQANFDTTDRIGLAEVDILSENNEKVWYLSEVNGGTFSDADFAVCEEYGLYFSSTLDSENIADHYTVYYTSFTATDISVKTGQTITVPTGDQLLSYATLVYNNEVAGMRFMKLREEGIFGSVVAEKRQTVYYAVYLASQSVDYQGAFHKTDFYVFAVEYDTRTITLTYSFALSNAQGTDEMVSGTWYRGSLNVAVSLPSTSEIDGQTIAIDLDKYSYYYMPVVSASVMDLTDDEINAAIAVGTWVEAEDGQFENDAFNFTIPFIDQSFRGYIALSVCNKAGFRSAAFDSRKLILIDNTDPDLREIFTGVSGETVVNDETKIVSVYSNTEIYLDASAVFADRTRANVNYYYFYMGSSYSTAVTEIQFVSETNREDDTVMKFTLLEETDQLNVFSNVLAFNASEYCVAYYVLFAKNSVATDSTGFDGASTYTDVGIFVDTVYKFIYDPSVLSGALSVNTNISGYDYENDTQIDSYIWVDEATIFLTATPNKASRDSNDYLRFCFSVNGENGTWYDYLENGVVNYYKANTSHKLSFTANNLAEYTDADGNHPFENGVTETFLFRAYNRAGTYIQYSDRKVYIAIDETRPEFEVTMTDKDGAPYTGGVTNAISGSDEEKKELPWTSGPVTVTIDITKMPASGVTLRYYLIYIEGDTTIDNKDNPKEILESKEGFVFTTDMLDGFNLNRDAIIVITAENRGNPNAVEAFEKRVRVSVDQVVPTFTMTGLATNSGASATKTLISGQWTNFDTVEVTKAPSVDNVSLVTYTYTWQEATMAEPLASTWSDTEASIKKTKSGELIVTATTQSGLTYTESFIINIDTVAPEIQFGGGINVIEGETYYIDLQVIVKEANISICEYITEKGKTRGFAFDPKGYVLSTSSVNNSILYDNGAPYRGYVHILVVDYAGNKAEFVLYILPFALTVNTITLSDEDLAQVEEYDAMLQQARDYMEESRVTYFENLIARLRDRIETLKIEIANYQDYLEKLASRASFELRSDYEEMFKYRQTFENYEVYGQKWIQTAITGDSTSKYYAYYKNFLNQFDKLFALKEQVEKVEADVVVLPAINMVESEDYEDILRVYDEYYDLTQDQRSCFTSNLLNKLYDLKESCEVLLLSDKDTGVELDGDFAPGATVDVTQYTSSTETYQNAQKLLMNTVSEDDPRAVVSIFRVSLTGAYAQTSASEIRVTLPIPSDASDPDHYYKDYINFAVYTLSDDGSMKLIQDTEIQPDGESIVFGTDSLGTFVLCVKANIQGTETTENTYGNILGLELDTKMIRYLIYAGAALVGVLLLIMLIAGIRHRRFLNSYNRAYRNSIYKKHAHGVPKGNKIK